MQAAASGPQSERPVPAATSERETSAGSSLRLNCEQESERPVTAAASGEGPIPVAASEREGLRGRERDKCSFDLLLGGVISQFFTHFWVV